MFLEMMLTNLLSNAFKFTPDGGIIRVALQRGEGCFRLTVRDSGIGIPQDQQERIFERFYQVNESHAGSGIGLSIVKAIMDAHNQQYGVKNWENGVEFWFTLDVR